MSSLMIYIFKKKRKQVNTGETYLQYPLFKMEWGYCRLHHMHALPVWNRTFGSRCHLGARYLGAVGEAGRRYTVLVGCFLWGQHCFCELLSVCQHSPCPLRGSCAPATVSKRAGLHSNLCRF